MNTQSLSASSFLSQSFINNFGGENQTPKNHDSVGLMSANSPMKFAEDSFKPSQQMSSNGANQVRPVKSNPHVAFSRSESVTLQIKTKQGDLVSFSFRRIETGDSGAFKMDQNRKGVVDDQNKVLKSEFNLDIEGGNTKGAEKQVSVSPQSAKTSAAIENRPAKVIEVKNSLDDDTDAAISPIKLADNTRSELKPGNKLNPADIKQDLDKSSAAELKQTANNTNKEAIIPNKPVNNTRSEIPKDNSLESNAPTNFSRLVVSSRSVLHMDIGGNKFSATQEQNYSIPPTNIPRSNEGMNNLDQQPVIAQTETLQSGTPSVAVPSAIATEGQAEELVNPVSAGNDYSKSTFGEEQSVKNINGDGGQYSFGSDFQVSIEGGLDEQEQQSIAELLSAMGKVSQDFFDGNVNSVFSQVQNMGFETEQIAGFSMNLNSQQSVQAVAAYQQVKMPDQNINTSLLSQASDFLAQAKATMANGTAATASFAEPEKSFTEMFAGVGQMYYEGSDIDQQNDSTLMFLKMVESISSDLHSRL